MLFAWTGLFPGAAHAENRQVSLAGLAYAGDAATLDQRFLYSRKYEAVLQQENSSTYFQVRDAIRRTTPKNIDVSTEQIGALAGRDQALVTTLVIDSETVSVERFGILRKLFVLIRGQALFFDFKTMTVVRSYPLSFAYIDILDREPSESEILKRVRSVYEGTTTRPGLYARYAGALADASIPEQVPRYLRVARVQLAPEVVDALPPYLKSASEVSETWAADLVAEAVSTRVGVPIVPFVQGYAVGKVMPLKVSDGTVYQLKLPQADYEISVEFSGIKKVKFAEVPAGASYVYGTFVRFKVEELLSGTVYMDAALRNGESKEVPATQTFVDDFPAFYDSWNGLFRKLSDAIAGKGGPWVKAASSAPDIEAQVRRTKDLMDLCK